MVRQRRSMIAWIVPTVAASLASAFQVPIQQSLDFGGNLDTSGATHIDQGSLWRLDVPLPSNTTGNLIFDTVSSLLQQWQNTRYRNGHNVLPATIPVGTLLYHGTTRHAIPDVPEWLAVDPEHAYPFCSIFGGSHEGDNCWLLTLAVSRPLNLLHFDGSSASKMYGCMDTQDMIAYEGVEDSIPRLYDEYTRIQKLCEWGKKRNIDGFLRMEMNFEIMLCDFKNGVEPVSFANLVPGFPPMPTLPPGVPLPPGPPPRFNFTMPVFRMVESGQWHNFFPGETRAIVDVTRLISFYDTESFPSLVQYRNNQERWQHRAALGKEHLESFMTKLDEMLTSEPSRSGIDWASIYRVVIHRYAERLEAIKYILDTARSDKRSDDVAEKSAREIHHYVESILYPSVLRGVKPPANPPSSTPPLSWASPVFERCATLHTKFISEVTLTKSEKLLLRAVNEVLYETCRVLVGLWAEGVELGLANEELRQATFVSTKTQAYSQVIQEWSKRIDTLMGWLDWGVWVKCEPACSFEETCYLPTWPFFHDDLPRSIKPQNFGSNSSRMVRDRHWGWLEAFDYTEKTQENDDPDWLRPEPKCMRRLSPYGIP